MKKIVLLAALVALAVNCGNDKPNNSNHSIILSINPHRTLVSIGTTFQFLASIEGASNHDVTWSMEGGPENGSIGLNGLYTAPSVLPVIVDSVRISARAHVDTTKTADAWAILVDPSRIYVNSVGSDSTGIGTRSRPYRSITKALSLAVSTQLVIVGPGQYDIAAGESFPLRVPFGVTVQGAGADSSAVTCPGGTEASRDTAFVLYGSITTIEKFHISSANLQGVGISLHEGNGVRVTNNLISNCYIGIYTEGALSPRPLLAGNHIIGDSIGIVTADSSGPIIRSNYIVNCPKYGVEIRDHSQPDLGLNNSTNAGRDTIQSCGDAVQHHWLIYNGSPDTIYAIGNYWQNPIPADNNQFIYDRGENPQSGPVILE